MQLLLSLLVFICFSTVISLNITWKEYLTQFPELEIHSRSEGFFLENVKFIVRENAKNHSYKLGLTPFLHLSIDEWKGRFTNLTLDKTDFTEAPSLNLRTSVSDFSWVSLGLTTPVKDQGQCGSCWSFSSTEAVESAYAIKTGKLKILSTQQLVDCSKLNSGCNGGLQNRAFKYLKETQQCLESDYSYTSGTTGKTGTCHSCEGAVPKLSSYVSVKADENVMASALLINPLAVAIEASQKQFQMYKSGILDFDCGTNLDHALNIEAMGTENGKEYWLVRNSWGINFG